jgi:glutathione S-transferase
MKLYFSPGSCSMAEHIALTESGLSFEAVRVDLRTGTCNGEPFKAMNPKGYVPALQLPDGRWLTEGVALLSYIADLKPESGLLPANGSWERYKALEWLTFISTELHKGFSPLWNSATGTADKEAAWERLSSRIELLNEQLKSQEFLLGQTFTVADAYAFTVLNWAGMLKRSLERWPAVTAYMSRIRERPAVAAVLKAEGLKA